MLEMLFSDNAAWFGVPAALGTVFFVLRMALMLLGGDFGHHEVDTGGAVDAHHGDPGEAFKVLSIQSVAAFLMGFGWGGLGALHGTEWGWSASALFALGCGIGMMWLLAMLLRGMVSLQSSGNVSVAETVGAEADVYVTVPASGGGRGQVRVVVRDRQRTYNAVSDGAALPSNSRVRITQANSDNTVTVTL